MFVRNENECDREIQKITVKSVLGKTGGGGGQERLILCFASHSMNVGHQDRTNSIIARPSTY